MSVWHNRGEFCEGEIQEPEGLNEFTLYAGPIKIKIELIMCVDKYVISTRLIYCKIDLNVTKVTVVIVYDFLLPHYV